jgi:hypothetical protein
LEPKPDTSAAAATVRVRIAHSHTLKEGWRLSETTLEWTGPATPNANEMFIELERAHLIGRTESIRRNAAEAAPVASAATPA